MIQYNLTGTWKTVKAVQARVSGVWKDVGQIYINIKGTWKPVWSYSWNTGSWGSCSVSCGNGTQTRTVTCKRNDGQTVADSLCTKYVGTKPATSQTCNLGACEECKCEGGKYGYGPIGAGQQVGCSGPPSGGGEPRIAWYWAGTLLQSACASQGLPESVTSGGYIYYPPSNPTACTTSWYPLCRKPA